MNPRSTDCEADALTTTPSRRLSWLIGQHRRYYKKSLATLRHYLIYIYVLKNGCFLTTHELYSDAKLTHLKTKVIKEMDYLKNFFFI